MADRQHLEFLQRVLNEPDSRTRWLEYKLRSPSIDLSGIDLSNEELHDFDFSDVDLTDSNFFNADLAGTDFSDARLKRADLRRAQLVGCCMDRVDLANANIQGASLSDACIEEANLSNARMQGANLIGADLGNSNLLRCDLRSSSLRYARLTGANLMEANVAEADLTGCIMDDDAPVSMINFHLSVVDDRRYRVFKSRLNAKTAGTNFESASGPVTLDDTGDQIQQMVESDGRGYGEDSNGPSKPIRLSSDKLKVKPLLKKNGGKPAPHAEPNGKASSAPEAEKSVEDSSPPESDGFTAKIDAEPKPADAAHAKTNGNHKKEKHVNGKSAKPKGPHVPTEADLASDEGCARILGVRVTDSPGMITKAFRAKAKALHPDKVVHLSDEDQKKARDQFELCRNAHDILKRRTSVPMESIKWVDGIPHRRSPYEHTIAELVKLVKANPGNDTLIYNLAWKYYEQGMLDEAVLSFERVLALNPSNEDAHHNLKVVKLQKAFKFTASGGK